VRKLLIALSATFVVVAATGVYQAFRYLPTAARAWPGQGFAPAGRGLIYDTTDIVHRWASYLLVALVLATAVVRAAGTVKARAWSAANVALAAVGMAAVAAIVTGPRLQWDQLALWAVTVGTDHFRGVFWSDESVKFILRGSQELGLGEFRRDVWLHTLVFPLLAACGIGVLWYACTRTTAPAARPESEEVTA
jgi:quinol---cytochrome c reductase cytochrome b subunit, bacillus type